MTKKNIISYVRVSTDEQAKMGHSLDHQQMMIEKYCEVKGYNILKVFVEDYSAKTFIKRPEWQKLLKYVKANKKIVEEILVLRWDRFSRNQQEALNTISELKKVGVMVNSIEQPLDMSLPENKILLSLYLTIPEVENDKISMRVTESSRKAKLEGCWMGTPPYGYTNNRVGKYSTLIPNDKKDFVIEAFNEVAKNIHSVDEVRKRQNSKGMKLTKQSFLNMLRNVVYIGLIKVAEYKKESSQIVKGLHEPIIADGLFKEVQDVLSGKKKVYSAKSSIEDVVYLRSHLVCPCCGMKMTGSFSLNGNKTIKRPYYHCQYKCKGVRFRADEGNEIFEKYLAQIKIHPAIAELYLLIMKKIFVEKEGDRSKDVAKVEGEIARFSEMIRTIEDKCAMNEMPYEKAEQQINRYTTTIAELKGDLAELKDKETNYMKYVKFGVSLLSNIDDYFKGANTGDKVRILSSIFPEKLVFENGQYRTARQNEILAQISNVYKALGDNTNEKVGKNADLSIMALPVGLEPTTL